MCTCSWAEYHGRVHRCALGFLGKPCEMTTRRNHTLHLDEANSNVSIPWTVDNGIHMYLHMLAFDSPCRNQGGVLSMDNSWNRRELWRILTWTRFKVSRRRASLLTCLYAMKDWTKVIYEILTSWRELWYQPSRQQKITKPVQHALSEYHIKSPNHSFPRTSSTQVG